MRGNHIAILGPRMCVLGHEPCGGSEVMLWEDVRLLEAAGLSVNVYGSAAKEGARVTTIPVRMNVPLLGSWEYGLPFAMRERKCLLMSCNEPTIAAIAPDRAVVRFEWATPLPRYWKLPGWLPRFKRARYLFLSYSDRQDFLSLHPPIPTGSTAVIPYFVDRQIFRPAPQRNPGPLRVGFAGQWVTRKGCLTLLDAWQTVRQTCPDTELWFAGSDKLWKAVAPVPGAAEMAHKIEEAAEQGWLKIAGEFRRAQMPQFWNSLDVAVVPSFEEPFGLVALEASACGIPVVASDVGGLKDIVVDGETGFFVPVRDSAALARALVTLLTDTPLRLRLGQGARKRAEQFSRERRSRELLHFLEQRTQTAG